jgi:hypothetical protein
MEKYNIIPMGDNCITAEGLNKIGLRKTSYPFDWVTHGSYFKATNIIYNFETLDNLVKGKFSVENFLGDAFTNGTKMYRNIWFPHDHEENAEETLQKYERRFQRLKNDVLTKKNIFIFMTRQVVITEPAFDKIVAQVLSYNPENKIVFFYGSSHPYMGKAKYKHFVAYQHLFYDITKITPKMEYEYTYYRPLVETYLRNLFTQLGLISL